MSDLTLISPRRLVLTERAPKESLRPVDHADVDVEVVGAGRAEVAPGAGEGL